MNENYLVTKSNTLITSSYDLSVEEQRIILTLASMVQPNDEDFKTYVLNIKDFMGLVGVEDKSKYTAIPKITKELMQKVFEIREGDAIIQTAWLSGTKYKKGSGMVELRFNPDLKPYMLGLKEFYTSYRLKNVLELKGKYSIRMYEILKSNEFKKVALIEVDELRKILKADNGSYMVYQNFRNRIILQAQKELKEKTDIYFDFEEIKTSRKVTALRFHIKNNKSFDEVSVASLSDEEDSSFEKVKSIMYDHKITSLEAKKIYAAARGDFIALMLKLVKPGEYIEPKKNYAKSDFNNYEQRTYDFDKLEKQLLGWE